MEHPLAREAVAMDSFHEIAILNEKKIFSEITKAFDYVNLQSSRFIMKIDQIKNFKWKVTKFREKIEKQVLELRFH